MTNAQIVTVLTEIANSLEIKGEIIFKVRAYYKAIDTISDLPEELSVIRARGALSDLPGIGASIAEKIEELLDTGHCRYHEQLQAEFPPSMLELLRIPEVGPKTVKLLYDQLGISSVDDLEAAAKAGKLHDVRGLGEKTEANIIKGIAQMRQFGARFPLARAYPMAQQILEALRAAAPLDRIEAAGSLRRMKETIRDLDIVVTSEDPEAVMEAVVSLPRVREVVLRGPTKTTILTDAGLQVDVRVVAPDEYGAALLYFTGSKEHNVKLRDLAVRRKLRINEYGIFQVGTNKLLGGATEAEIYEVMGMPWIPPELREDQGEIEAALQNRLPKLIELSDIRGDLHVHSKWSDGRAPIDTMVKEAVARGYDYLAICDHSPMQVVANGMSIERLRLRQRDIERARKKYPQITLLAGSEVDIHADGHLDYPDEVLAELDFVVASVHSGWKASSEANTERILRAIANPYVTVIGHPTGRLIGSRAPYEVDIEQVIRAAAAAGVALEIDASPERLDLKDTHARLAKELGAKLIIDTDTHSPEGFDLIHFGVATARRAWLEASDVLNTLPRDQFLAALRKRPARKTKVPV